MESYIKKINRRIVKKHDEEGQKKLKKIYLISGGVVLALGLAGLVAAVITFVVLFLKFETDEAMTAWFVAVPFMAMIVAGSVVTRIGDMLLKDETLEPQNNSKKVKEKKKNKKAVDESLAVDETLKEENEIVEEIKSTSEEEKKESKEKKLEEDKILSAEEPKQEKKKTQKKVTKKDK